MGHGEKGRPSKKLKLRLSIKMSCLCRKPQMCQTTTLAASSLSKKKEDDNVRHAKYRDFTKLELKPDHPNRPIWACPDGRIFLESFSALYKEAYDFLIAIAEPVCRDDYISQSRITSEGSCGNGGFTISTTMGEVGAGPSDLLNEQELATVADKKVIQAFEVDPTKVEDVKQHCLPDSLNYPMLEEYDFRNDTVNPDLDMELKPQAQPRPYQEKSLSKMVGNGRARSGIIVLPCGARKSLVGVSAASRIKKSCLV
ncbi:hypothetical protein ACLB2K_068801 [Fragaria x ananassa]